MKFEHFEIYSWIYLVVHNDYKGHPWALLVLLSSQPDHSKERELEGSGELLVQQETGYLCGVDTDE